MNDQPATSMTILRDPQVYLVGKQTVNDEGLAAFLDDHDIETWSTDTEVAERADPKSRGGSVT